MASILGKQELSEQLAKEAEVIKLYVQTKMYDSESGFFYDIRLNDRTSVKVMGLRGGCLCGQVLLPRNKPRV